MAFVVRWWGWAVFVALLAGVGAATHALVPVLPRMQIDGKRFIGISADGKSLFTLDFDQKERTSNVPLRVWDTQTGLVARAISPNLSYVNGERLVFSPDHSWLLHFPWPGEVIRVDMSSGAEVALDLNP